MFNELRAMHHWRLTPRTWALESEEGKAQMMAYQLFENTREAYRQEWKEAQREGRASNRKDSGNFAAMRERMKLK